MSEPRSPRPYSLAGHVYAGNGLDTLSASDVEEVTALLVVAERSASRPLNPDTDLDRLIAGCLASPSDPFAQWRHELVVDESLREMVTLLLPASAVECHRVAYRRLRQAQGLGQ